MHNYTRDDIFHIVEEEDVAFIRLQFTDIFGTMKNMAVTVGQLEKALDNCCMFDVSSLEGVTDEEESDMYLYPDLDSFEIFPWRPQTGKVARLICDIHKCDGTPFEGDSRYILKRVIREAAKMGIYPYIAPECEFCLFPYDTDGEVMLQTQGHGSYFDVAPLDTGENVRRDIILALEDMGIDVRSSYHEHSPYQHEIDLQPVNALAAADNIVTFRMTCKTIASRHGLHATFMPKPMNDSDGCGMHLKMTLMDLEGNNILSDPADSYGLSELGYHFMAGIMAHVRGLTAVTNPLVNSYKRLVPGFDAPTELTWTRNNQNSLVRIPRVNGADTRIELRSPDAASNPYLVFAVCLAAGLDGIQKKIYPTKASDRSLSESDQKEQGIENLPENLREAITLFEDSSWMKEILGETFCEQYVQAKRKEWLRYSQEISDWEIEEYLYRI